MRALILDTETTDTGEDAQPIEIAWLELDDSLEQQGDIFCQRYKPTKPISYGAMGVHHIHDLDLVDCPPPSEFKLPDGVDFLIGHSIDFDWRIIGSPDIPRICTLALARSLWPDIEHTQSALMYYKFGIGARPQLKNAHSAAADVQICEQILHCILEELTDGTMDIDFQKLWEISELARVPTVMPFGKHKGLPVEDVPRDYVAWLLRQPDVDPYLRTALTR